MTLGVNNLVENTKVTLLEQGLAIVSLDALAMMIPNGIGVIVPMGFGTTHNYSFMKLLDRSQALLVNLKVYFCSYAMNFNLKPKFQN